MPGWSVSEKVFDSPAATFSTSPRIRLPSSTSNSVTAAVPVLDGEVRRAGRDLERARVTALVVERDAHRARALLPAGVGRVLAAARGPRRRAPRDRRARAWTRWSCGTSRRSRQRVSGSGPLGSLLGLAAQAPAIRPDDVEGHRDDVEEPEEDLARGGLGLQAEHAGEQRAPDRAGSTSQLRSSACPWRLLNQPASCAVCTEVASSPAATKTSTSPVPREEAREVDAHAAR